MNIIKHVLFATDDSEDAFEAYRYALSIAEQHGARLTLLHVVPESSDLSRFDIDMGRSSSERKWLEAKREYVQQNRDEFVRKIKAEYGKEYSDADDIIVEMGIPSKIIVFVAKDKNCDFIVMGMRGRGKVLGDALIGNTLRRVMHQSKLPVLVVQPPEERAKIDEND